MDPVSDAALSTDEDPQAGKSPNGHALLADLSGRFDVVAHSLALSNLRLTIYSLRNPDRLLDEATLNAAHDELAWHPYWGKLWESAIGLASFLENIDLAGRRVLDLGCGLGLTGAVAAAREAHVVLADHAPPALDFAKLNVWPWRDRAEVQLVDWRIDDLRRTFDLILGADIVYDRADVPFLESFWRRHLAPQGRIFLSDPARLMTLDLIPLFEARGWHVQRQSWTAPFLAKPIHVFELTPAERAACSG